MIVLVCGGRNYVDRATVYKTLDSFHAKHPISLLISGGARGADTLAEEWAFERLIPVRIFHVPKEDWAKYGGQAGPLRNQKMLNEGRPEVVIAFPGGRGTNDMIGRAKLAGIKTIEVTEPPRKPSNALSGAF